MTLEIPQIVEDYRQRWQIETAFRDVKQHFGFDAYRLKSRKSINRFVQLSFVAASRTKLLFTKPDATGKVLSVIERVFQERETDPSDELARFLVNAEITDHVSMREFFEAFAKFLSQDTHWQRVVLTVDEFDAIPRAALKGFLRSLRYIYLSGQIRCLHSIGIIGVKGIPPHTCGGD